jgi:muramidase (phage lysozyme)
MPKHFQPIAIAIGAIVSLSLILIFGQPSRRHAPNPTFNTAKTPPLMMTGGDPYIRALMRTISSSEANDRRPYSILYGGSHVTDLSQHPQKCIRIVNGPNMNNCSTAAGRYQMINTTWATMAKKYHPQPDCVLFVFQCTYSFEPQYQDAVVHAWLSDERAWNLNISQSLKSGDLDSVRRRLSSTWTSLGYGIETNTMTPRLTKIYQQLIKEELEQKP